MSSNREVARLCLGKALRAFESTYRWWYVVRLPRSDLDSLASVLQLEQEELNELLKDAGFAQNSRSTRGAIQLKVDDFEDWIKAEELQDTVHIDKGYLQSHESVFGRWTRLHALGIGTKDLNPTKEFPTPTAQFNDEMAMDRRRPRLRSNNSRELLQGWLDLQNPPQVDSDEEEEEEEELLDGTPHET